ncbi:hypothetical protein Ahy_A01g003654 [Arachis hypogaea]|uniref:Protein FAR1-RELATED SEQUENCE n=1 Tax=Arachis hypogaea TaxID=3818 RepID=A0A445ETI2_ARAHY|nr:hypothetical protein Ahy_A01g003654 [Arachis hypogaea]
MQQSGPPARTVHSRCAFFPMSTSQNERVLSVRPPSCTPPSRSSFIEYDMVEPLGCVPFAVAENLSNQYENVFGDVVVDGEKLNKLLDYGCLQEDEIPRVGMRFAQLQMAHDFYVTYAKKVGFATKKRTITYDITKIPVNQAIHCNHDRFCGSHVKAPTRKNMISAVGCKARIYVKFDKDMQEWILASYEYYGDVVSVDSTYSTNRHGLPFMSFVGVNHHGKSTLLGCTLQGNEEIPSYEWVFNQWVKCMENAPQRIITDQCRSIFHAIRNVLRETRHRWCICILRKSYCKSLGVTADLYDDQRMWVPIYFKGEFWAAMRNTQRSESMHAFYGGFLHSRTSLVQFVHEYDNVLGIKEQRELEDDAVDSRGDVQTEFVKKADYRVSVVAEKGASVCMKVEEEKLVNNTILCVPYDVHFDRSTQEVRCECNLFESLGVLCCQCLVVFYSYKVYKVPTCYVLPRWSKKIKRKHTYVKSSNNISRSDESHVAFKGLCAHFYNIAQEFIGDHDKTALLHPALEETRTKLVVHRAKKRSNSMVETHTSIGSQSLNVVGVADIQGSSKVSTKGRPKSKRLDAALEKSFKNSARRKNKNAFSVVCPNASQDVNLGAVGGQNISEQAGGFMSLLNSFNKS